MSSKSVGEGLKEAPHRFIEEADFVFSRTRTDKNYDTYLKRIIALSQAYKSALELGGMDEAITEAVEKSMSKRRK
jgi:hypothetical protein